MSTARSYCRQCGKGIGTRYCYDYDYKTNTKTNKRVAGWSGPGDGLFCTINCAREWAIGKLGGILAHPDVITAKSCAVEAKEKARAEFVRPDSDALDRMRRENPIIELFKAARSEEGEEE